MAAEGAKKKIMWRSSDGEEFEVDEAVAKQSEMFANMVEDGCTEGAIPLLNVAGKVLEYCKKHADEPCSYDGQSAIEEEIINSI